MTFARPGAARATAPRLHWLLLSVMLVVLAVVLLVNGLVKAQFGADHRVAPPTRADTVPDIVRSGRPILDLRHGTARTYAVPDHTIVLTFDDGPDPVWTPRIVEVLERHRVPATFFVVGNLASQHPDLVRRIHEAGSELGIHTFTHPDLAYVPGWRRELELSQTQLAVAAATGRTSSLVRPPYSSAAEAIDDTGWPAIRELGNTGYVTVLTTHDTQDWARPGVDEIVRHAIPENGDGAVVLMHDAGGDRSQTVEALDRLIPELRSRGYRFATVGDVVGEDVTAPATRAERLRGDVLLLLVRGSTAATSVLAVLVGLTGALVVLRLLLLIALARRHARRHNATRRFGRGRPPVTEPVSVIVPAYNEAACIARTVRSLAASDHPVEVIVVDDGSTDGTAEAARDLQLPGVTVFRRPNGGKPAALNTGIAQAEHDLIVMMDGDTVFGPDTVRRLVQPFADPGIGAVAGNTKVANRGGLLGAWQHIEYVVGFNIDRRAYDVLQCMPTVPGAVGAFRRRALSEAGGVSDDTLAEDTDLTMAISRAGWRIVYEPDAVARTEVPTGLGELWRQRYRWSYGTIQSMWKHRRAVFEPGRSGRFGRLGLLHLALFQVALPLLAPLMDVFLVYGLLFLDPVRTVAGWLLLVLSQLAAGVYACRLDGEPMRGLWLLPLQQLVYRQLMYAVVIQSIVTALTGIRLRWQKLHRLGEAGAGPGDGSRAAARARARP
ncbi:bifunctional polysaccharide deacetylase/glycosyltransferase family 2 protein [Jiangella endophytica]|uniref:bifunctional polysaccharide deacetylase/glycosyltransferase family 2 protein n=1 Tax=Jiangella endophytica TaxID=1623398 RepID=UPI000E34B4E4|nr:bifunctional polysaccharide deacetylase/glycosyltransferase family 2 protein [Jiangella endophytica]